VISELSAFGSPVRPLMVAVILIHALLVAAFGAGVWLYAIATLLVVAGFGPASSSAIRGIAQNLTPWAGAFERINAYAYFAWIVVLAVMTMRRRP
jgi:hypothetical protein